MMGRKIAANMMTQMMVLALLYVSVALLAAIKFLPDDKLVNALSYPQVAAFSHVLLELTLLTGAIGAALYIAVEKDDALIWVYRGWTLFLIITFLAGALDLLEGRHLLELPPVLDVVLIVLLVAFMLVVVQGDSDAMGQGKYVWLIGMSGIVFAYMVSLIPVSSILVDRVLRVVMVHSRFNVSYVLLGLTVVYWFPRQMNLYLVAGTVTLLGTLASFIPLIAIEQSAISGWIIAGVSVVGWIFVVRELTRYHHAPQVWLNLGMIIVVFSIGILATVMSIPRVAAYSQGTLLTGLQLNLVACGVLLILIGFARHVVIEKPAPLAFWLVAVGLVGSSAALLIAASTQTIMERVLTIGFLDVQNALVPLYALALVGLLVMGCGIFWLVLSASRE
jgi:hypothetical protein